MRVLIRPGDVHDQSFVYALGKQSIPYSVSPWRKQSLEDTLKYRESALQDLWNWIRKTESLVLIAETDAHEAEGDGAPVKAEAIGYLILQVKIREELTGVWQGWIMDIAVLPEWRGQGIGKALVRAAEDKCREFGVPYLGLAVSSHNIRALRLYEQFGFVEERKLMVRLLAVP